MRIVLLVSLVLLTIPLTAKQAPQWPQFHGPGATGVGADLRLPDTWSASENIVWKTAIPGVDWSSPIVWNNTIFLTSVIRTQAGEAPKPGLYEGPYEFLGRDGLATLAHRSREA